jgi:hypothetical protein
LAVTVQLPAQGAEGLDEVAHTGLRAQVDVQGGVVVGRDAQRLRGLRRLGQIAAGHDDEPALPRQRLCGMQAHAGRGAGDDDGGKAGLGSWGRRLLHVHILASSPQCLRSH